MARPPRTPRPSSDLPDCPSFGSNRNFRQADISVLIHLGECIGDNALIENPMEDRGIELRLSVPVRRITLQIALDANVVKDLKSFICRVLSVVNAMNSTAHD